MEHVVQASGDLLRKRKQMAFSKQLPVTGEAAEMLAVQALAFIAQDADRLGRFLAITGIGPMDIRDAAAEPNFLAGVLDYVAGDEGMLLAFAKQEGLDPAQLSRARNALTARAERDTP
jgi:hypothetical protein